MAKLHQHLTWLVLRQRLFQPGQPPQQLHELGGGQAPQHRLTLAIQPHQQLPQQVQAWSGTGCSQLPPLADTTRKGAASTLGTRPWMPPAAPTAAAAAALPASTSAFTPVMADVCNPNACLAAAPVGGTAPEGPQQCEAAGGDDSRSPCYAG